MQHQADSRYAWTRLIVTLALMTIGSNAMYVVAVVLPSVQAEFGVARADASLPYTLMMVGFGIGGVLMGTPGRPIRRDGAGAGRRRRPRQRLRRGRHVRQRVDILDRTWRTARAAWQLHDLRAAGGRHLAVVRAPARHRSRDLRERQLLRGRAVAAARAALRRDGRTGATPTSASACSARSPCRRWPC